MMKKPRYVIALPDLQTSAAFYRTVLGFEIHKIGDPGWRFCEKDDIDRFYDAVVGNGAVVVSPLTDEPWGMREFGIRTADGHRIRFGSRIGKGGHPVQ